MHENVCQIQRPFHLGADRRGKVVRRCWSLQAARKPRQSYNLPTPQLQGGGNP